ncbi:MAG: Enoyl-CoA hydratase / 3-hydroxyacyl-CoA dehydrogenase / 3-hydroxybutyryl-CoA epimerase [uncultured Corynebacteriales bacterium]|uniref:Enoyl-CoA hydratase / 3-hydroxyacyl-CoA dehydrogenase / 3-hydroxybutyryl-CoA epimerase n=1 Tax=uncultured Mycobacteriales bacterium TaxID=581187 RepID=A0A6J4IBF1_9ACTN|nr:MAG: Enoyl-CoA hydratase / 3-hydroxyacyl-CoA dehydrogenase / 3-hydroxybutyryl-CoA epimerase [uncultured Corynebacteriales bacterium]
MSIEFPGELVTKALVRYVEVPGLAGELALITLDNGEDHAKPSTFGPGGLRSLAAALDDVDAHSPAVAAVAVTGKPFIFAVGADLKGVGQVTEPGQATEVGRLGHQVFRRLRDSAVPTFAFVNGAAMGGGLELALHCHYRTLSRSAAAVALPEVFLGLVPGWGGTQLLPNLVGAARAVTVVIENPLNQNKMLKAAQAYELGIADVLLDGADFLAESLRWAARVVSGAETVVRPEIDRGPAWDEAIARGRALADAKVHGAAPAPYRALDLLALAKDADLTSGFAAEDETLSELIMGEELRAGLYAFDLVQRRAKRPVGAPDRSLARPVTKVGVVGAGLMAGQLALLFARRLQVPVVLTDLDQQRLDRGVAYVHGEIDGLLGKKRIGGDEANRLKGLVTGSLTKDAFADADFVIEAVFEELKVKRQVLAEVEAEVSPTCVLATNTSSLSVSEMAAELEHPERVVGFHFFNPVAVLPLLEVVRAERTDDATLATAFAVGKALKKSCVLVKDAPAFVVNRLLTRFMGEVIAAVDEGTPVMVADRALEPLGLPMTPFTLLALVGPAVSQHVGETLHAAFPDRFGVSENLGRLVAAGKPGVLTWGADGPGVDPEVEELFVVGSTPSTEEQVRERALGAVAQEIRLMLDEGVVAEAQDVDLCMLLGAGWPFHLGGITPYLDRSGVAERVTGRRFLPPGVAGLPA